MAEIKEGLKMNVINTHTGKIYVDTEKRLEFLTVGDYGKENNIKADFLGLTKEINGVQHKDVDLRDKWVVTISTQKGCPMNCSFCDCPKYGFFGNCTKSELEYMVKTVLENENVKSTKRLNVHFARMGEPTFNFDVISFTAFRLRELVKEHILAEIVHPVVSTMLPAHNPHLKEFLNLWCDVKNLAYIGEAGLQLSINSTDDDQRAEQFNRQSLYLKEISRIADKLPEPLGRKYTLNFAVTKDTILDAQKLKDLFDPGKFIVKITPIHQTVSAKSNGYDVGTTYHNYDVYRKFEQPLLDAGFQVIVFVPSEEEDSDRITCGNALIAEMKKGR